MIEYVAIEDCSELSQHSGHRQLEIVEIRVGHPSSGGRDCLSLWMK